MQNIETMSQRMSVSEFVVASVLFYKEKVMKRIDVMSGLALGIALLVALPVVGLSQEKQNKKENKKDKEQARVTLNVEGVECARCAQVMTDSLEEAQVKPTVAIKPETTGPSRILATCPAECDLGAVAAKVNQADTPHREKVPPTLSLVLFANLDAESASTAVATCQKIEGVDGKACQVDPSTGEIQLRISGKEKVTLAQIVNALKDAGIQTRTTSTTAISAAKAGS